MAKRRNIFDTESVIDYSTPAAPTIPMRPALTGRRDTPQGQVGGRESDVTVPVLQSLAVSVCYASLASVLAASAVLTFHLSWYIPVVAGLLALTLTASWTMTRNVSLRQELWWGTEEIVRRDLDGDGVVGKPEPEAVLRVEIADGGNTKFLDVPAEKVAIFARAVVKGQSGISEGEWKKFFGGVNEFRAFRGQLLGSGLVRWKNPDAHAQGVELTLAGRQVLKRLATTPLPEDR